MTMMNNIYDIETPAYIIDENKLEDNLRILKNIEESNNIENVYQSIKLCIKLNNDLPKLNGVKEEFPKLEISNTGLKNLAKEFKTIREELSMLHERINTEKIRKEVFSLPTLEEQKAYVDKLYEGKEKQNKKII